MTRYDRTTLAAVIFSLLGACSLPSALAGIIGHMTPAEPLTEARVRALPSTGRCACSSRPRSSPTACRPAGRSSTTRWA